MSELFAQGRVAVITGAASGIGRAAAERLARLGMSLVLFDANGEALQVLADELGPDVRTLAGDVARMEDVERLRDLAYDGGGDVAVVMNNAAISAPGTTNWLGLAEWRSVMEVNLWGVVNGVHAFAPAMLSRGVRAAIINTGSKQGITNPPGEPAYAVSKAGVKILTEQLAHGLRQEGDGTVTAHLLVPGWTFTGMSANPGGAKPEGAWTPEQVVDRMIGGVDAGDFYIICPDNAVSPELDAFRLRWSAEDMIQNRPALSRWHPDWKAEFDARWAQEAGSGT